MAVIELVDAIPLAKDAHGVYRVGGTRVTLDIVVRAFNRGATAEEIVQEFPSLQLPDVYQVIGYYLKHRAEFAAYFEKREREEKELLTRTSGRPGDCVSACWRAGRIREVAGGRDSQERAGSDAKPKQKLGVAVGIAVARYPPHRSVRADFPHIMWPPELCGVQPANPVNQ
jgi:uncharacterized protein (DUF433 family)